MNPDSLPFDPNVIACGPTQPLLFARLPDGYLSASLSCVAASKRTRAILHLHTNACSLGWSSRLLTGPGLLEQTERVVLENRGEILARYNRYEAARKTARTVLTDCQPSVCLEVFSLQAESSARVLGQGLIQIRYDPTGLGFRVDACRRESRPGLTTTPTFANGSRVGEARDLVELRDFMESLADADSLASGVGTLAALGGRYSDRVIAVLAQRARSQAGLAPLSSTRVGLSGIGHGVASLAF